MDRPRSLPGRRAADPAETYCLGLFQANGVQTDDLGAFPAIVAAPAANLRWLAGCIQGQERSRGV